MPNAMKYAVRPSVDEYPTKDLVKQSRSHPLKFTDRNGPFEQAFYIKPENVEKLHKRLRERDIYPLHEAWLHTQNLLRSGHAVAKEQLAKKEDTQKAMLDLHFLHAFWLCRIASAPQFLHRPFFLGQLGLGNGWPLPYDMAEATAQYLMAVDVLAQCTLSPEGVTYIQNRIAAESPNPEGSSDAWWQVFVFTSPIDGKIFKP